MNLSKELTPQNRDFFRSKRTKTETPRTKEPVPSGGSMHSSCDGSLYLLKVPAGEIQFKSHIQVTLINRVQEAAAVAGRRLVKDQAH